MNATEDVHRRVTLAMDSHRRPMPELETWASAT